MAKDTYKIIFLKDSELGKAGTEKTGISFDQQMEYMMENFIEGKTGVFKIEPEKKILAESRYIGSGSGSSAPGLGVKKTDSERYNEDLKNFYEDLPAIDVMAIKENRRKIVHSETAGFYLRDIKAIGDEKEIAISIVHIREKEKREIHTIMKRILMGSINGIAYYDNNLFDHEDLEEMIKELFKGKI